MKNLNLGKTVERGSFGEIICGCKLTPDSRGLSLFFFSFFRTQRSVVRHNRLGSRFIFLVGSVAALLALRLGITVLTTSSPVILIILVQGTNKKC